MFHFLPGALAFLIHPIFVVAPGGGDKRSWDEAFGDEGETDDAAPSPRPAPRAAPAAGWQSPSPAFSPVLAFSGMNVTGQQRLYLVPANFFTPPLMAGATLQLLNFSPLPLPQASLGQAPVTQMLPAPPSFSAPASLASQSSLSSLSSPLSPAPQSLLSSPASLPQHLPPLPPGSPGQDLLQLSPIAPLSPLDNFPIMSTSPAVAFESVPQQVPPAPASRVRKPEQSRSRGLGQTVADKREAETATILHLLGQHPAGLNRRAIEDAMHLNPGALVDRLRVMSRQGLIYFGAGDEAANGGGGGGGGGGGSSLRRVGARLGVWLIKKNPK